MDSTLAYVRHRDGLPDVDDATLMKVIFTPCDPSVEAIVCRLPLAKRVRCKVAQADYNKNQDITNFTPASNSRTAG